MNDAKSAPFAYMVKAKNPCIPPKLSKSSHFGKLREIHRPFFNLDHEKWKPQILQQNTQNPPNSPILTANHAKLAKFTLFFNYCSILVLDIRKTGSNTLLARIMQISQP